MGIWVHNIHRHVCVWAASPYYFEVSLELQTSPHTSTRPLEGEALFILVNARGVRVGPALPLRKYPPTAPRAPIYYQADPSTK